jgi:soluble epoxide hydrolase / lipid-phosphate phosphatase
VIPMLRRREVDAGHWALWEKPEEINRIVKEWMVEVVFTHNAEGEGSKL